MAPRTKSVTTTPEAETSDYPAWWDWDDDGDVVAGTFVGMGKGFTAHGERVYVTLAIGGVERTVWLHWSALLSQFSREVHRRPDKTIHAGERVIIRRLGERTSGNGRDYINFDSEFPDGPETSQADLLSMPGEPTREAVAADEPTAESENPDGDIPF